MSGTILPTYPAQTAGALDAERHGTLRWAGTGAVALPLAVLSHEAGHYLLYRAFGFPGAVLHHASATHALADAFWAAARAGDLAGAAARGAAVLPAWQVGVASGAGLVVTYACLAIAAAILARSHRGSALVPLAMSLLLVAPLRFLAGIPAVLAWLRGADVRPGTDEGSVSLLLGLPAGPLAALGLLALLLAWVAVGVWIARARPSARHVLALVASAVGGGVLYATVVGPWLIG